MFSKVGFLFQVLCLANGERIQIGVSIRMIFEVDTLSQASPATISRCGMVYFVSVLLLHLISIAFILQSGCVKAYPELH